MSGPTAEETVAIVGVAARLPGATNIEQFWHNLTQRRESVHFPSDEELLTAGLPAGRLIDPDRIKAFAEPADLDMFDADFFGFTPREAAVLDPQIRMFLEVAHAAVENAGYDPYQVAEGTGVYATTGVNEYLHMHVRPAGGDAQVSAGSMATGILSYSDYIATHVAYRFGFRGPAIAVSTACSSSAVAVHLACQALRTGECDMALAGGAEIEMPVGQGYQWHSGGPLSPDGHCRPFDVAAAGTVFSSGAAAVVLKRLSDAMADGDHIWAVIRASAVNNDGASKGGFSVPGVAGQVAAVREACLVADVTAADISYIEAHATGTVLGDPIEIAALTKAYRGLGPLPPEPIPLSSVKGNVGHLGHAAGITSLVKVALCMANEQRVGTANFTGPNPRLGLAETPFVVNDAVLPWPRIPGRPRIAGMNSLGIGGTNVHLVVQEAPERAAVTRQANRPEVVVWSARTPPALVEYQHVLAAHLDTTDDAGFADCTGTLQDGRTPYPVRAAVVAADGAEAAAQIRAGRLIRATPTDQPRPVALLFPGQAAQYPSMAVGLHGVDRTFTRAMDSCLDLFVESGLELREPWLSGVDITDTGLAQPLLFAVQYALAQMWQAWGVRPAAVLGHSVGELTAAAVAGVFTLPDAVRLVAVRAAAMAQLPAGGMLAVAAGPEEVTGRWPNGLPDGVVLAVVNGPRQVVLAGPDEQLAMAAASLTAADVPTRRLATSHAFHTPAMEPARQRLADAMRGMVLREPCLPMVSAASGEPVTSQALDADFWSGQVTRPVRFDRALSYLLNGDARLLLEIGPRQTLGGLVRQHPAAGPHATVAGLGAEPGVPGEYRAALAAVGTVWTEGHAVDWAAVRQRPVRRTPLPGYRYQRARHWLPLRIEPATTPAAPEPLARTASEPPAHQHLADATPFTSLSWVEQPRPRTRDDGGGAVAVALLPPDDAAALPVVLALQQAGYRLHIARPGPVYGEHGGEFRVRPDDPTDLDRLVAAVTAMGDPPVLLAHGLALPPWPALTAAGAEAQLTEAYHSVAALAQAALRRPDVRRLMVFATRSVDVTGVEPLDPAKAALHGVVRTLAQEAPELDCRVVDLADGTADGARVEALAAEISVAQTPVVVALRGHGRWVRVERPHHAEPASPAAVRRDGVYLLTGGLGGLGLAIARELAGTGMRPHLVLVGRGGLPDGSDEPTQAPLRAQIAALERLGARVRIEACDVADRRATRRLLDRLRAHLGAVHGVVHLAGVPGGGMLVRRQRADADAVLRPKVQGTLVLAELLADLPPLDFFVAFSSRAAVEGLVGGADYAAGNAVLDAYIHTMARAGRPALSINWPAWHTVGMAARPTPATDRKADGERGWETVLRVEESPVLDEHRLAAAPVLPGSGVLDLVLQAFRGVIGPAGTPATFTEVVFQRVLDCSGPRRVTVLFQPAGDDWAFRAVSVPADADGLSVIHATGSVRAGVAPAPELDSLEALRKRLPTTVVEEPGATPRMFTLGPRWRSVRRVTVGADHPGERLVEIALAEAYHADLRSHPLHPALLDIATAEVREPVRDGIQLPFRYGSLAVYEDLPARFISHIRRRPRGPGMIVADVDLLGDDGRLLARITEYTMRAVGDTGLEGADDQYSPPQREGIAPTDGARLFRSQLGEKHRFQVVVRPFRDGQPVPLTAGVPALPSGGSAVVDGQTGPPVVALTVADRTTTAGSDAVSDASTLGAEAAGPGDVQSRAARLWTQVLGMDGFGPDTDFFELGGTSLTAVELTGLVRDEFGVRFSVVTLFDNPTLAGFADALISQGAR